MKRLAITFLVLLGSSVALGYAGAVSYRVAEPNIELPTQVVVRCLHVLVDPANVYFIPFHSSLNQGLSQSSPTIFRSAQIP